MTALVASLTVLVIALAAAFGAWRGARHMLRSLVVLGAAALAGAGSGMLAYRLAWFVPLGLITPAAFGLLTLLLIGFVLARSWRPSSLPLTTRDRAFGSVLGSCGGVLLAAELWLFVSCAAGVAAADQRDRNDVVAESEPGASSVLQALVHTANRGFVRHLPLLGELGDEVEATLYILNAPAAARSGFAQLQRQWLELKSLDSYRELVADEAVTADLDALRDGDLLALYRLQKNPRFLSFFLEAKVQSLLPGLRPTTLAQQLAAAAARDHH